MIRILDLSNGGFAGHTKRQKLQTISSDEMYECGINLDIKTFVHRPDAKYMNTSAAFLQYQASCLMIRTVRLSLFQSVK